MGQSRLRILFFLYFSALSKAITLRKAKSGTSSEELVLAMTGDCVDEADWVDSNSLPCSKYESFAFCLDGASTGSWNISQFEAVSSFGVSALEACCACGRAAPAPVDCVGTFENVNQCSTTCGSGTQVRIFSISTPASNGGSECAYAHKYAETQACNVNPCPGAVDCVGSFEDSTQCSATCGDAIQLASYLISTPASNGGKECAYANGYVESRACNKDICEGATDCVGSFESVSQCSAPCGGGFKFQTFTISTPASDGGSQCNYTANDYQIQQCNTEGCPVNQVQDEGESIIAIPAKDTNAPGGFLESAAHHQIGSADCVDSYLWTDIVGGTCSDYAGFGICANGSSTGLFNTSTFLSKSNNGLSALGACCVCGRVEPGNPVDCVGSFNSISNCSATCGGGAELFLYSVSTPASNGGTECAFNDGDTQTQTCSTDSCPNSVDCVGSHVVTSPCTQTCGTGWELAKYVITTPASNGGLQCPFAANEALSQMCNTDACLGAVDCSGAFETVSQCSQTCGTGVTFMVYRVNIPASGGGQNCPYNDGQAVTQACTLSNCASDCVGSFGSFSDCSTTCDGGVQTQTYSISAPALEGGQNCTNAAGDTQTQVCNTQSCSATDCVGSFVSFSLCTATCGSGVELFSFSITTAASDGGIDCANEPGDGMTQACNTQECTEGDVTEDPHFHGFDGSKYDFQGEPGYVFNIISDRNYQLNAQFVESPTDHQTFMGELGFRIGSDNVTVSPMAIKINGKKVEKTTGQYLLHEGLVVIHDLLKTLVVSDGFEVTVEVKHTSSFVYLNIETVAKEKGIVQPHGLLGQTANFLVNGGVRHPMVVPHSNKNARGFIEGSPTDYTVADGILGTQFLYNRYQVQKWSRKMKLSNILQRARRSVHGDEASRHAISKWDIAISKVEYKQ